MPRYPLLSTKSIASLFSSEDPDEGKASSRFKEGPEKAFRKQDIQVKASSAKSDEIIGASIDLLAKALEQQLIENEVASFIKNGFDEMFGGCSWNVIVGRNFGSHISCSEHVHLTIAKISVIIFKLDSGVPPQSPRQKKPNLLSVENQLQ